MKVIVVSAVNLNKGGTLTILRDCLGYLSQLAESKQFRVIAIVYKRELVEFPNIEYIEKQWPKKRWVNRLWFEYVSLRKLSRKIGPIELWLSLHDTSPNVVSKRKAVYAHNSFPFYKWKLSEWYFAPKIVLFALFSKYIYRINLSKNDFIVVQQQWLKKAFVKMFNLDEKKLIVALPKSPKKETIDKTKSSTNIIDLKGDSNCDLFFLYPALADSHKNFECLCEAVGLLESQGVGRFKVFITVDGSENKFARWLAGRYKGKIKNLEFIGTQNRSTLYDYYAQCDCLVFPSKVETWGLPITEFSEFKKPMLLADLPYARETASGQHNVAFFDPNEPLQLASLMRKMLEGDRFFLQKVDSVNREGAVTHDWDELFDLLLQEKVSPEKKK